MSVMNDDSDERRVPSLDIAENLRKAAEASYERASARRLDSSELPPSPSITWYRIESKRLLELKRREDPGIQLSAAQHEVARSLGFTSWQKFVAALEVRKTQAESFLHIVQARDESKVGAALAMRSIAVVDAGMHMSPDDLWWLGRLRHTGEDAFLTLDALHDAIAEHRQPEDLAECLEALFNSDRDFDFAMNVVNSRLDEIDSKPGHEEHVELLNEALSVLANYDEPESDFDIESDGD